MCLLFFAYDVHPRYRLVLAANRDEFYHRPTESAHFWESHPEILAGRDLEMMGTWMGITKSGRLAALTNFRDPSSQIENPKSRGYLVRDFLESEESPIQYLTKVENTQALYNPFNILVGDLSSFMYFNNQSSKIRELKPGFYGLSNHFLDTPWPKVRKSKQSLIDYFEANQEGFIDPQTLFEILADSEQAQDDELPSTGISRTREKMLSPIFIQGTDYGTRSSTVLYLDRENTVLFQERSFRRGDNSWDEVCYKFKLSS
ncbi:NRDE family protein [Desulfosporosinus sp. SB140]|uniref:NRDE family protein n=1 Tax=Desulfosporosinus paludis TaxID=3115649 RepID=UPI00388E31B4